MVRKHQNEDERLRALRRAQYAAQPLAGMNVGVSRSSGRRLALHQGGDFIGLNDTPGSLAHTRGDSVEQRGRKAFGQAPVDSIEYLIGARDNVINDRRKLRLADADALGRGNEVAALDLSELVVPTLSELRHRHLGLLKGEFVGAVPDDWPSGDHVVEGRHLEAAAGQQMNAEVLCVTIGCGKQPHDQLRFEEADQVLLRLRRSLQKFGDLLDAWPAIGLVLCIRRDTQRLAHVFLRKPKPEVVIWTPQPVKPFNHQRALIRELPDLARRYAQAILLEDLTAQPFVFNRVLHVPAKAADEAKRELEDVRARRHARGAVPLPRIERQSGFLLRAGNGDAEVVRVVVAAQSGRARDGVTQAARNRGLVERFQLQGDLIRAGRRHVDWQKLDSANAIPSDCKKQIKGIPRCSVEACLQAPADQVAIREQVLEEIEHCIARERCAIEVDGQ